MFTDTESASTAMSMPMMKAGKHIHTHTQDGNLHVNVRSRNTFPGAPEKVDRKMRNTYQKPAFSSSQQMKVPFQQV